MIGINCWVHDSGEPKKVMIEHKITWRSSDDENDINRQWDFQRSSSSITLERFPHKWIGKPGKDSVGYGIG